MSYTMVVIGSVSDPIVARECCDRGIIKDCGSINFVRVEDVAKLKLHKGTMLDEAWEYMTETLDFDPADVVALIAFEHEWLVIDGDASAWPHVFEHDSLFPRLTHRIMLSDQPAGATS